ncbi:hypothetical protein [Dyella acidiphila]|uniref:DUF4124 domain-containing protein n=1 Tax=Dyella acidiphila TaxID=2775866 RepID=A0ABR9GG63_9GAMM|nr:hypothetical protein [Dyella acidiphila]MBE1163034.1 hypothetical protein [Dyella acidiphila]
MDNRVFWSMLCALLVFSGFCGAGYACVYAAQREALAVARVQADDQARAEAVAETERTQQQQAYPQWIHERELLQPNQRCLGGVVVEQRGSTYTQIGYPGHPAHCVGDYADQPMR